MLLQPILETLFAISMASAAVAAPATEKTSRAVALPISYGRCYRIQNAERQFLGGERVCQRDTDGECQYASERPVNEKEDFFLWDFAGAGNSEENANLLAGNNPGAWGSRFYTGYRNHKKFFHFNGEVDDEEDTTPAAIRTGGHNGLRADGIAEEGQRLTTTRDESRRLLWYHEVECPE